MCSIIIIISPFSSFKPAFKEKNFKENKTTTKNNKKDNEDKEKQETTTLSIF